MQLRATKLTAIASAVKRAFNISSLFAGGAKGVWYDPSDFSTLFQDSAGTTPVTAVEQPVGLMLDKSQGLVLGPELVTNGDFSNGDTGWILSAGVTVSGGTANWTAGASNLSARQTGILTVGKTYQVTYTISSISSGGFKVSIGAEGPTYTSEGTYTARLTASSTQISLLSQGASTTGAIDNITVKELPGNHAFQSTSASRPVLRIDGNGKYFLRFDGVDDSLSTNSISFTSTDKMSVFAGVRKLSDAATAILAELSINAGPNDGTFFVAAPVSASANYQFTSKGTVLQSAAYTNAAVAAPITNTLTGLGDISGDRATLRINGAQLAQSTSDQGTGNFGNYPLFIGRRGNSSLPFNGQLYSMVIVGKAVTAGELTSTETYVNQKTGAY